VCGEKTCERVGVLKATAWVSTKIKKKPNVAGKAQDQSCRHSRYYWLLLRHEGVGTQRATTNKIKAQQHLKH
jgi:hypothetical protein